MSSRVYPRAAVRRVLKRNLPSGSRLGSGTETLAYLDYVLFTKMLAEEAAIVADRAGSRKIDAAHVRVALERTLRRMRPRRRRA